MAQTVIPSRATTDHPTRRALLAGVAAAPALALPAVASDNGFQMTSDPHPVWWAEWRELLRWCNSGAPGDRELREFPQWDRLEELEELISTTAAVTLAGVRVQLAQLHHVITEVGVPNDHDVTGLAHAIATLDRLAGRSVA